MCKGVTYGLHFPVIMLKCSAFFTVWFMRHLEVKLTSHLVTWWSNWTWSWCSYCHCGIVSIWSPLLVFGLIWWCNSQAFLTMESTIQVKIDLHHFTFCMLIQHSATRWSAQAVVSKHLSSRWMELGWWMKSFSSLSQLPCYIVSWICCCQSGCTSFKSITDVWAKDETHRKNLKVPRIWTRINHLNLNFLWICRTIKENFLVNPAPTNCNNLLQLDPALLAVVLDEGHVQVGSGDPDGGFLLLIWLVLCSVEHGL